MTIYLPKASPNTNTMGVRKSTYEFGWGRGGHIHSIHSRALGQVFSGGISVTNID